MDSPLWHPSRRQVLTGMLAAGAALAATGPASAQDAPDMDMTAAKSQTRIKFHGHSAFSITTPSGKVILIDPWIINPANPKGSDDVASLTRVDMILISHLHSDHVGEAVKIAKTTQAQLCAPIDTGKAMAHYLGYPREQVQPQNMGGIGGTISVLDNDVKITFVNAVHGSTLDLPEVGKQNATPIAAGVACGFILTIKNGPTIYHTGDTDLFADMESISWFNAVDYMLVCIGDRFTMGPERAAYACRLVKPSTAIIPMHYDTTPLLTGSAQYFKARLSKEGIGADKLKILTPGEAIYAAGKPVGN